MLSKGARLAGQKEFRELFQAGRSTRVGNVKLVWRFNKSGISRIGVVVPNKATRTIVERNRLKRQLRAVMSKLLPQLKSGFDIAIVANSPVKSFQELRELIKILCNKAGLLS